MDTPPGIWYEKARDRWRVKLIRDGQLIHRSYHREYAEALAAWQVAKKKMAATTTRVRVTVDTSDIGKFLRQPPPGLAKLNGQ